MTPETARPHAVQEEMLGWLARIAEEVNSGDVIEHILENVVSAVVQHSPWSQCWVGWFDPAASGPREEYHAGFDPQEAAHFDSWPLEGSPSERAISTGQPVVIPDVTDSEFQFTRLKGPAAGFGSALFMPIRVGEAYAIVSVYHAEARDFDALERSLAGIVASFAAIALRNVVERRRELEAERVVNARLSELNQTISEQNEVLRRLATAHEHFQQLQLHDGDSQGLADATAGLLTVPVVLLDRFFEVSSWSGVSAEDAHRLARRVAVQDGRGALPRVGSAHPATVAVDDREVLIGRAADGRDTLGFVLALRSEAPVDDTDVRIVELACVNLRLDALRQRAEIEADIRLQQDFVDALATAGTGVLSQRAALLGVRVTRENSVLRVRVAGADSELSRRDGYEIAALVRRRLLDAQIDVVVTSLGGGEFAVVLPTASLGGRGTPPAVAAIRTAIVDGLGALKGLRDGSLSVTIGIGTPGAGVDALRTSNAEALRALEVLQSVGALGGDLEISDGGSLALLTFMGREERTPFIDRYLRPLVTYDRTHSSGLIQTLKTYFAEVGSVQRTAEELFLHISTVRYRLSRIEEIANVSLRNEEDRLCLQLALRLAGLVGPQIRKGQ